jgi:hypothetical protein
MRYVMFVCVDPENEKYARRGQPKRVGRGDGPTEGAAPR